MGESEQSPASRYALICQRCFAHNGLVLKDEVMDIRESQAYLVFFFHCPKSDRLLKPSAIEFLCPKCGGFNPSRRSRMTGATSASPAIGLDEGISSRRSPELSAGTTARLSLRNAPDNEPHHQRASSAGSAQSPTTDTDAGIASEAELEDSLELQNPVGEARTDRATERETGQTLRKRGKSSVLSEGIAEVDIDS